MALIINLFGGPGTGKSTTATSLFSLLKMKGFNAEYVSEYAKQWAWEERKPIKYDQFYFFGKQARKEYSLFEGVDVIITDSPVSLCAYYADIFGSKSQSKLFQNMAKQYYSMAKKDGHIHINIWLNRVKKYNPKGRFQNEAEARAIDTAMHKLFIGKMKLDFTSFDANRKAAREIYKYLKKNKDL